MKKTLLIASGAFVALAVPAIAMHHKGGAQEMLMAMPDMTRAQMEAMVKDHFAKADANKDGAVTKEEMKSSVETRRTEHMEGHFKAMDSNGDGTVSREEFMAGHQPGSAPMAHGEGGHDGAGAPPPVGGHGDGHRMKGMGMKMGERMFDKADSNNDGKVTLAEATKAATSHFDAMDADKNGTVTSTERMDYMKAKMKEWRAGKDGKS